MKRKKAILFLILALVLLLTGCWNRRELNELAIAVGMGIDKQGDQFRVSLQVVDPGKASAKKEQAAVLQPPCIQKKRIPYLKRSEK